VALCLLCLCAVVLFDASSELSDSEIDLTLVDSSGKSAPRNYSLDPLDDVYSVLSDEVGALSSASDSFSEEGAAAEQAKKTDRELAPEELEKEEAEAEEEDEDLSLAWNERFQEVVSRLLEQSTETPLQQRTDVNVQLLDLSQDFIYTAKTYGKIIISERYLPTSKKIIKPVDIGGHAGGTKVCLFVCACFLHARTRAYSACVLFLLLLLLFSAVFSVSSSSVHHSRYPVQVRR
jgi:Clustered mitochondria